MKPYRGKKTHSCRALISSRDISIPRGCRIDFLQLLWFTVLRAPRFDIYNEVSCGGEIGYKITMN